MLLPLRGLDHPLSACEIRLQLTKAGVPSKEDQSIRAAWRESKERRALAQAVSCTEKRQAGRPGHVMARSSLVVGATPHTPPRSTGTWEAARSSSFQPNPSTD
jgi:hypothetical protein